jgi:hypothetical protein
MSSFSMSMGWDYISELRPPTGLLFILRWYIKNRVMVEWYWQGKTEELGEKYVPVPLCPQIPYRLIHVWTWTSMVRGQWLTTSAMAWSTFFRTYASTALAITESVKWSVITWKMFHVQEPHSNTIWISRISSWVWADSHMIKNITDSVTSTPDTCLRRYLCIFHAHRPMCHCSFSVFMWDFKFSRQQVWCSELSSGMYCRVK